METGFELNEQKRDVTTAELDTLVKSIRSAREEYDKAKALSSGLYAVTEKLEQELLDLLGVAGKNSYELDGVARVSVVTKTQVTTPKTPEEKTACFNWIKNRFGDEGLVAYQTINHQTLNSLYNSEMKNAIERGLEFNGIDGIGLPMVVKTLSVRSK